MEKKNFQKSISFDRVFYSFDSEIGLHFYFYFKPFQVSNGQREREREREKEERVTDPPQTDLTPAPAPPSRSSPPKTDPPTKDLSGADVTDLVLVLNPMLIGTADLVVSISSHQ